MGKFHHSKKHHGDKKKSSSSRLKYDLTQAGRRKLPEDFLYTQNHKSIWNSFSNFLDEKFAEEDLSEILDEEEVTKIKNAPAIPPMRVGGVMCTCKKYRIYVDIVARNVCITFATKSAECQLCSIVAMATEERKPAHAPILHALAA